MMCLLSIYNSYNIIYTTSYCSLTIIIISSCMTIKLQYRFLKSSLYNVAS